MTSVVMTGRRTKISETFTALRAGHLARRRQPCRCCRSVIFSAAPFSTRDWPSSTTVSPAARPLSITAWLSTMRLTVDLALLGVLVGLHDENIRAIGAVLHRAIGQHDRVAIGRASG